MTLFLTYSEWVSWVNESLLYDTTSRYKRVVNTNVGPTSKGRVPNSDRKITRDVRVSLIPAIRWHCVERGVGRCLAQCSIKYARTAKPHLNSAFDLCKFKHYTFDIRFNFQWRIWAILCYSRYDALRIFQSCWPYVS